MLQARPLVGTGERHVYRDRLLDLLPDSPGHVVWLHAPVGYGKSILAAQWAESLEISGWRILWTAMLGDAVNQTVAAALRLPADATWALIQEELAVEPTLLVVEDLKGDEELEPLLRAAASGLVLLASRTELQEPELLKRRTERRLLELQAAELAFTMVEAEALAGALEREGSYAEWQETGGWPLLLHFALLTGEAGSGPLHVLLQRSVSAGAWQEALFLGAAGTIEHGSANDFTRELVRSGFLQVLQRHYRLHPLLADHLLRSHPAEVRSALVRELGRLRRMEPARASLRSGHLELLAGQLDALPLPVVRENMAEYLRLCQHAPALDSRDRRVRVAYARLITAPGPENVAELLDALSDPDLAADGLWELETDSAVLFSRLGEHSLADRLAESAASRLGLEQSLSRLQLLGARVLIHGYGGQHQSALDAAEQASAMATAIGTPEAQAMALQARQNCTPFRFELTGDTEAEVLILSQLLADDTAATTERRSQLQFNLAVELTYLGEDERALQVALECSQHGEPFWRLWADVLVAFIRGDNKAFPELYRRAGNWGMNSTRARVAALWLRSCRRQGDLDTPRRLAGTLPQDAFVQLELALHALATGSVERAGELLELTRDGYPNREFRQHWHAASYMITRNESELDKLLALSSQPLKLLRYVMLPLGMLPLNRPELSVAYPMEDVLRSDWQEAIEYRRAEIPRLQLELLGGFRVGRMGKSVQLSARQQQIIALLALGVSKERVATELWPESPAVNSSNNLNVQLHMMRRNLEPWGLPTYLNDGALTHADTDLGRLRQAMSTGNTEAVVQLYRGDLAPELDAPALVNEREGLRREVLEYLIEAAATARPADSLPLLERVLELDPLHEQAMSLLAGQLIRLGRRNAARIRIGEFSERLANETGLRPTRELLALLSD